MPDPDVFIAGAGPTGLALALWLAQSGIRFRIVDKEPEPGTTSRALAVQARTLEFYRQLGIANDVAALALEVAAVNLWVHGKQVAQLPLGDIGESLSPYPNLTIFPQDQHERFLIGQLRLAGITVERNIELTGFDERNDGVVARLKHTDGREETCTVQYLVGCDGTRSSVREGIGAEFPGGTYHHLFYIADVELHGPVANHQLHIAVDDAGFLASFPLKGENAARLVGTMETDVTSPGAALTWNDVSQRVMKRMCITVDRVHWFSTYRVHHRVAARFRRGRVFLAGDAAHIHSPVGGQGMNTGIGDAVNLAWKLAAAVRTPEARLLLDSYEPERIAFAHKLVATTDRVFVLATRDGWVARFIRRRIVPILAEFLFRRRRFRRFAFRTVSQTMISYAGSDWSDGDAGFVRGGDRLPWVKPDAGVVDNFTPLTSLDWQVHVYGAPPPGLLQNCTDRGIATHVFPWRATMGEAGLQQDCAYLVRPDGHVAIADLTVAGLQRYLDKHRLTALPFTGPASSTIAPSSGV